VMLPENRKRGIWLKIDYIHL